MRASRHADWERQWPRRVLAQHGAWKNLYLLYDQEVRDAEPCYLVAFANCEGGVVFFGVDDDGLIIGLPDTHTALPSRTPIGRDRRMPPLSPVLARYAVAGRDILALRVMPELNRLKPYRTAGGRFYLRAAETNRMRRAGS